MALNFNLLNADLPGQIATSAMRGYEGAQDRANVLAERQQLNQLNALKMREAIRGETSQNALANAYKESVDPATGAINYNKMRQSLAVGGGGKEIPAIQKQELEQQQTEAGLFSSKMDVFKTAWSNVRTLDDALAVHEKTHNDPVVGRMLESMGITKEQGTQRLIEAAKNPETWTNYLRQAINGADAFKQQVVGGSVYDFNTGQFKTPTKQQEQPPGVQEYQFARTPEGGGYKGSYQQFLADKSAAGRAPTGGGGGRVDAGVDSKIDKVLTDETGRTRFFNKFGQEITPTSATGEPTAIQGKPSATFEKTRAQKQQLTKDIDLTINELSEITKKGGLIDQSTGSGAGRLVDVGARFVGQALPGDIAIGKLQPVADMVLKMVPRFEGPQSDKDTASYKEAAGQLANASLPREIRKAAGIEVLRLMKARKNQFVTQNMADEGIAPSTSGASTPAKSIAPPAGFTPD